MQTNVELTTVEKFKPVEITIKLTIEKPAELLELLDDEQLVGKGPLCSYHDSKVLSSNLTDVVRTLLQKVKKAYE